MKIDQPNIILTTNCPKCGKPVAVNSHTSKYIEAGKRVLCPECMHGKPQQGWTPKSYQDYLKSNHWHVFRKRAFRHYGRKCYVCGTEEGEIHLHHNNYSRLGGELLSDVIPLCDEHHRMFHGVL